MLSRSEIETIVQSKQLEKAIHTTFTEHLQAFPRLTEIGPDGDDYRFGVAEQLIRKFFKSTTAQSYPGGPFGFISSELRFMPSDIVRATQNTVEDYHDINVPEVEVAVTATFIWFILSYTQHDDFMTEYKYFLYWINTVLKADEQLKAKSVRTLPDRIKQSQNPVLAALAHLFL